MKELIGKGGFGGIARGPIYFYNQKNLVVRKGTGADPEEQNSRYDKAREVALAQLDELYEKCREEAGEEAAGVFIAHQGLVEDEDFVDEVKTAIREQKCLAEYAVKRAGEHFSEILASMKDPYLRERSADVRDVAERLIGILTGSSTGTIDTDVPVILYADDLSPSETILLDKKKICAILLRKGAGNSHTAILSRSMAIPYVYGLTKKVPQEWDRKEAYIIGHEKKLVADPDEKARASYEEQIEKHREHIATLEKLKGLPNETKSGRKLDIYCNIGLPNDVDDVLSHDGGGIGLFRSEFVYLESKDYPSEEKLFKAFKEVAERMDGKEVVIRTLDIGADKKLGYFNIGTEENPALGMRAIRICLTRKDIFKTQLRAIYRASAFGNISIMLPMIASVWEIEESRILCREVEEELAYEGIPFKKDIRIGIMIETPAAVLMADELAKHADFFSIGTNDLTQYTLACDRQNASLSRFSNPHNPAVIKAIEMTAEAAHRNGIRVAICGELGGDISMIPTFLDIGIDEISVSPKYVLLIREKLRELE